jgi:hypothetical protein
MDEQDARDKRLKRKGTFYANTNLYTLIRLVQVRLTVHFVVYTVAIEIYRSQRRVTMYS